MGKKKQSKSDKKNRLKVGKPVPGFNIEFEWNTGVWELLFDQQVEFIQNELRRAQAADRVIVYLSCPISARGGGHHETNVDIAHYTARKLMMDWGTNFFVVNPCNYQMESKEGTGLIRMHAERLKEQKKIDIDDIDQFLAGEDAAGRPAGGDYMRMWTKVLVEDSELNDTSRAGKNLGGLFDAYYFLGPSDVREFFTKGGATTATAGIEEYLARKIALDEDFHDRFENTANGEWEKLRKDFFRFYSVRASANFSKGCHDEWNIFNLLNARRLSAPEYGLGEQIAGFFDGKQIVPGAVEQQIARGYAK